MPMYFYECECGESGKRFARKHDSEILCIKCGKEMQKNVVKSVQHQTSDRVPGGYDDMILTARRTSKEGMEQEAAFLAGESNNAY